MSKNLLLISVAAWFNQQQRDALDYLREQNRVLREQLGNKRLRLNDAQRPRLARFLVLFLIDLSTRRVEIAGIATKANGLWMD